jgi:hypothetical protein
MPTYRYRRANDTEPVEIVAASYELAPSGVAVFHDVTEENGRLLRRTVEVRRVRMTGDVELPECLGPREVDLRMESLVREREVERHRLEALLRARDVETLPAAPPKRLDALLRARDVELRRERFASSHAPEH